MFRRLCFNRIRGVEAFLHGGPETAEQIYEREDSFQVDHSRRRGLPAFVTNEETEDVEEVYTIIVPKDTLEVKYEVPEN